MGRRDAHTVGGKGDAGPSNLTLFHLLVPSMCSVSSRDWGWGRLAARAAKWVSLSRGNWAQDCVTPLRRIRA